MDSISFTCNAVWIENILTKEMVVDILKWLLYVFCSWYRGSKFEHTAEVDGKLDVPVVIVNVKAPPPSGTCGRSCLWSICAVMQFCVLKRVVIIFGGRLWKRLTEFYDSFATSVGSVWTAFPVCCVFFHMCICLIEFLAEGGLKVENAVVLKGCGEWKRGKSVKCWMA